MVNKKHLSLTIIQKQFDNGPLEKPQTQ